MALVRAVSQSTKICQGESNEALPYGSAGTFECISSILLLFLMKNEVLIKVFDT